MKRVLAGEDEVRFPDARRTEAALVAAFLPDLRRKAQEATGCSGPKSLRVVLADRRPRIRDILQFSRFAIFLVLLLTAVLVACALFYQSLVPIEALAIIGLLAALYCLVAMRAIWRGWHHAGGLAVPFQPALEMVILLNLVPPVPPSAMAQMAYELSPDEGLRFVIAHEYVHHLLRHHYRVPGLPVWLDEGLAFWLGEQMACVEFWRPESRTCLSDPEPREDPRRRFGDNSYRDTYLRLMARYYWQVKALADAGRVKELLRTPLHQVDSLRAAGDAVADRTQGKDAHPRHRNKL
jgi:hypothetical protein